MGSGCCCVYFAPLPTHAPYIVEVARLWAATMGWVWGQMEVPLEEGTKNSRGRRAVVWESAQPARRTARDMGEHKEVEEGEIKLKGDFIFQVIVMQEPEKLSVFPCNLSEIHHDLQTLFCWRSRSWGSVGLNTASTALTRNRLLCTLERCLNVFPQSKRSGERLNTEVIYWGQCVWRSCDRCWWGQRRRIGGGQREVPVRGATDGAWWRAQVVNFLLVTSVHLSICYTGCLQFVQQKLVN